MTKDKPTKGHVLRVSHKNFARIKKLKGERTLNELIDSMLSIAELMSSEPIYKAGDKIFNDVAAARGHEIQLAVREKRQPNMPEVLVCIGVDSGD